VIQNVLSIVGHIEVRVAVVVVIADGHAHSIVPVAGIRQASRPRNVRETPIAILPIQTVPIARVASVEILRNAKSFGDSPTVDKEDVEKAVVVVVKKSDTAGHGFDQKLPGSRRILKNEIDSPERLNVKHRRASSHCRETQEITPSIPANHRHGQLLAPTAVR
jgi:hypothetical protein